MRGKDSNDDTIDQNRKKIKSEEEAESENSSDKESEFKNDEAVGEGSDVVENIWKQDNVNKEKSREEEFDEYLEDLFLQIQKYVQYILEINFKQNMGKIHLPLKWVFN